MKIIFLMVSLLSTPLIFANEEKALKAIEKLGENLQLELSRAMRKSPTYAVAICNIKASEITKKAAKEGIKIGRVSPKNRNPDNTPKDWMLEYIEQFQNKKIDKPYIVTAISSEKMGLLKPIITQPLCTKCHGSNINSEIRKKILSLYPHDKATGYEVGQIRGYFWAEFKK